MEEVWRDVASYEGKYKVSNLGRVKSVKRTVPHAGSKTRSFPEKILKPNKVAFDYYQVTLYSSGKRKCRYVQNLVMEAFVGPRILGYEVNHKNEVKSDNRLCNLEYLTHKENNNYGDRIKKMVTKNLNGKQSKKVKGVHLETGETIFFPSMAEGVRQGFHSISDVCLGKAKHCKGYKWEVVE